MGFYKIGSNMAEEIAVELDRDFLLDAFKKMYKLADPEKVKELVRLKLQSEAGFIVMAEMLGLSKEELISSIAITFPDMFSHKFCKYLRNSYFDKRCETCGCYMPRKGVCKMPERKNPKTVDKDTKGCKRWTKR